MLEHQHVCHRKIQGLLVEKECMICVVPRSFNSLTGQIKFVDNSSVLNFPGMRAEEWQCPRVVCVGVLS